MEAIVRVVLLKDVQKTRKDNKIKRRDEKTTTNKTSDGKSPPRTLAGFCAAVWGG